MVENTLAPDEVKRRMLGQLPDYLQYLFPQGKRQGAKFRVGNVQGNKGQSLEVALTGEKAGLWYDFAIGKGGDIVDLTAAQQGLNTSRDFSAVIRFMSDWLGMAPVGAPVVALPKQTSSQSDLGKPAGQWDYLDGNGQVVASVLRFDTPTGKTYRPWDAVAKRYQAPTIRPLYNQPGMLKAKQVIVVEGEKAAQALIDQRLCATSAMNGAKAPTDKTDWSPLNNKHIIIWPDNDDPGKAYGAAAALAIEKTTALSISILTPPLDKPEKWDAADAVDESMDIQRWLKTAERQVIRTAGLQLSDWYACRYQGNAPVQEYLIDGVMPLGVVCLLAAMGDTGKGMLTLKLALEVACQQEQAVDVLGGRVAAHGTAVIFSSEDDQGEIHRRLQALDPQERRLMYSKKLMVIPLPNAGGPFAVMKNSTSGPVSTPAFTAIVKQLRAIDDLKLVIFDPLSSFVHADINADPAAGSYLTGQLANLATETGASVILVHHMRKASGQKPIDSPDQARDAIRGTTALVDGVRMAYALWPASDQAVQQVCTSLNKVPVPRSFYQGAVVKANGLVDRGVRTYQRNSVGLLEDLTARLNGCKPSEYDFLAKLAGAIRQAAERGYPMTHTGVNGVYAQRHRLDTDFHNLSRHRLEHLVQSLLNERPARLVKGMAKDSKESKWLDSPFGLFAQGEGVFAKGSEGQFSAKKAFPKKCVSGPFPEIRGGVGNGA